MRGPNDDAGVYVISVAAELAGIHPQTLRMYERKGLLAPARSPEEPAGTASRIWPGSAASAPSPPQA